MTVDFTIIGSIITAYLRCPIPFCGSRTLIMNGLTNPMRDPTSLTRGRWPRRRCVRFKPVYHSLGLVRQHDEAMMKSSGDYPSKQQPLIITVTSRGDFIHSADTRRLRTA